MSLQARLVGLDDSESAFFGHPVVNLFLHNRGIEEKIPMNDSHPEMHLRDHLNCSKQDGKRPSWKTKLIKMIMEDIVLIIMTSL